MQQEHAVSHDMNYSVNQVLFLLPSSSMKAMEKISAVSPLMEVSLLEENPSKV